MGDSPHKKRTINWLMLVGLALIIIAIIFFISFLMHGEVKIDGQYPEPKKSESITCEANGLSYPFFKYDNSNEKNITIRVAFNNDELDSISLVYMLYYSDDAKIVISEAENHGAMNLKFQSEGLGPDALEAKYARLSDGMKMSLYANSKNINDISSKYFYLENIERYDLSSIQTLYQGLGFNCKLNTK